MADKIDALAQLFIELAGREHLNKVERKKCVALMKQLKLLGMSCHEISELSVGRWSPTTIRTYTAGIKAASVKKYKDVVSLLQQLNESGLVLDDVEDTLAFRKELKTRKVELGDLADVISSTDFAGVDLEDVIEISKMAAENNFTRDHLQKGVEILLQCKEQNLEPSDMFSYLAATKQFGSVTEVVETVKASTSLDHIKEEIAARELALENLETKIEEARQQLEKLNDLQEAASKVSKQGFTPEILSDIAKVAGKFGGVNAVIEVINNYDSLEALKETEKMAHEKVEKAKGETAKLWVDHTNLKTAIDMCLELVEHHGFGPDGIAALLAIVGKFGDPVTVFLRRWRPSGISKTSVRDCRKSVFFTQFLPF